MRDLGLYRDMSENTENYNVFNTKINALKEILFFINSEIHLSLKYGILWHRGKEPERGQGLPRWTGTFRKGFNLCGSPRFPWKRGYLFEYLSRFEFSKARQLLYL